MLLGFMFSAEFQSFMDSAVGTYTQRPETALTMDVYRGALSRLPDSGGFDYWRGTVRTGQCNGTSGSAATYLVSTFFNLSEYASRNRTNRQFMADVYDVIFRRVPDVNGYNFWVGELDAGRWTRQGIIDYFYTSGEWSSRASEIAAAGCVQ